MQFILSPQSCVIGMYLLFQVCNRVTYGRDIYVFNESRVYCTVKVAYIPMMHVHVAV
jgi:hypothetical protein